MSSNMNTSKEVAQHMLFYYLYSLIREGHSDPKKIMAQELGKMLELSESQMEYVMVDIEQKNKFISNLESIIKLTNNMIDSKTIDLESLNIIKDILTITLEQAKVPIHEYFLQSSDEDLEEGENDNE